MAHQSSFDSSLSSSVVHHPAGLSSFAPSFHEDDYDPPPPGVDPHHWARLQRAQRRQEGDEGRDHSELSEHSTANGGRGAYSDSYGAPTSTTTAHHRTRTSSGANRPPSSFSSRPTSSSSRNYPQPTPSYDSTLRSDANDTLDSHDPAHDQSTSTEVDRTQTTELLSARLGGGTGGDGTTVDESTASEDVYALGKPAKKRSSGGGVGQNMTLREQEKVIDELKKDNFSLKLKLHFYEQRLEKMAPSSVEQALRENIQLKVEFQTLRTELKRYKKLLLEGDRAIQNLSRERDELAQAAASKGGSKGAVEKEMRRLREERADWEDKARELQREVKQLRAEGVDSEEVEELRAANSDLERHLHDAEDELQELRHELADAADRSGFGGGGVRREVERLEGRIGELEEDNTTLRSQLSAQLTMLSTRNDEKLNLQREVEELKADLAAVENELEHAQRAATAGRGGAEGEGERDELERDLNAHRDRAAALALELDDTKTQLDAKEREIEELVAELDEREGWREEVEGARQLLEDKEADIDDLSARVEQLMQQLTDKEAEFAAEEEEVEALTHDLQKLGAQIFELEGEIEQKDAEADALRADLAAADKELENKQSVHEQVVRTLKENLADAKKRLSDLTIEHESLTTERSFLSLKVEDLALANAKLEERARGDDDERKRLQEEAEEIMRALRKEEEERDEDARVWEGERAELEEKWRSEVDELEQELKAHRSTITSFRGAVADRDAELTSLHSALDSLESSTRRQGENASSDRVALELERDRVKRELVRVERELAQCRAELEEREREAREATLKLATLQSENKDLASQLASQTQTRLALADKHDAVTKNLHTTQLELTSARDRLRSVEDQLSTDHRALGRAEGEMREQLAERNGLLLTVYQYMERVSGKKAASSSSDPKPFTSDSKVFGIFHDRLLDRLKAVGQLQMSFERRAKELEGKFVDQFNNLKRQSDARHKQLDRFEASIKTATETQRQWRVRVQQKQVELDAAKAQAADLQSQLASLRRSSAALSSPDLSRSPKLGSSPSSLAGSEAALQQRLSLAQSRVSTLERRLTATQAQLKDAEDKLGEQRSKIGVAEGKWEARFRELEGRCRAAEERVKRERQGAKERVGELQGQIQTLEQHLVSARRRDQQLDDVLRQQQQQQRPSSASGGAARPGSAASAGGGRPGSAAAAH
ncbi:hypothetical protein JCM8097_001485 [Rhodosporidiobolus ruineniae]